MEVVAGFVLATGVVAAWQMSSEFGKVGHHFMGCCFLCVCYHRRLNISARDMAGTWKRHLGREETVRLQQGATEWKGKG
jgi:hypothetical protein